MTPTTPHTRSAPGNDANGHPCPVALGTGRCDPTPPSSFIQGGGAMRPAFSPDVLAFHAEASRP
jgi:hypothetical protein